MSARLRPGFRYLLIILFAVGVGALLWVMNQNGVDKQLMSLSEIFDVIKGFFGK